MKSKKAAEELGLYPRWILDVTHRQSLCSVYLILWTMVQDVCRRNFESTPWPIYLDTKATTI